MPNVLARPLWTENKNLSESSFNGDDLTASIITCARVLRCMADSLLSPCGMQEGLPSWVAACWPCALKLR